MSSWRKRTRLGVGIFGVAFAIVVYFALGERNPAARPTPVERLDPKAVIESTSGWLQQAREAMQDFEVQAERTLTYEDGSSKQFGVRITVRKKSGRDFVVVAREAQAGANQRELRLSGDVTLTASDGFELMTDSGSYSQDDGIVRAPGAITFKKGRMQGSGVGMAYDKNTDVLNVLDRSQVTMSDEGGATTMSFSARTTSLDRVQDFVKLDGGAHVVRGKEVLESTTATGRLSPDEQIVTLIELRGESRVVGDGTSFTSMSARDVDLDYTDDGKRLERVVLTGAATVALAPVGGSAGRQLAGEALDLQLAEDGSLTHAAGRDNVRFDLPAATNAPARGIKAKTFDASGQPGAGLTDAQFVDEVEYRELAARETPARVARSRALQIALTKDDVRSATFTGGVTFEERSLTASAGEARYDPEKGTLQLTGSDGSGGPRVSDEQVTVAGPAIDVALETRRIAARGGVKTTLVPPEPSKRNASPESAIQLPGLLQQDTPANVNAHTVVYEGSSGSAVYSGDATLWQGETAIRGETIRIDREKGDLVATGLARSTLALDSGQSVGRAHEIRYDDATRVITYDMPTAGATRGRGVAPAIKDEGRAGGAPPLPLAPQPTRAQLSGPQGDLRAQRIELLLESKGSEKGSVNDGGAKRNGTSVQRLEAYTDVALKVDSRNATAARLTYHASDERYVLTGAATEPVTVIESCRETLGKTLTFFRSTDRILVDGNEEIRTQTKGGGPCPQPPSR